MWLPLFCWWKSEIFLSIIIVVILLQNFTRISNILNFTQVVELGDKGRVKIKKNENYGTLLMSLKWLKLQTSNAVYS